MIGYNEDMYVVDGNDFYCVEEDCCDDVEFGMADEDECLYCDGVDYEEDDFDEVNLDDIEMEEGMLEIPDEARKFFVAEDAYEGRGEGFESDFEEPFEVLFEQDDVDENVIITHGKIA